MAADEGFTSALWRAEVDLVHLATEPRAAGPCLPSARLAFCCTPLSLSAGVSMGMEGECQQNDSLAHG